MQVAIAPKLHTVATWYLKLNFQDMHDMTYMYTVYMYIVIIGKRYSCL